MTRLGSSILASDLVAAAAGGAPGWKELVSIDPNPPTSPTSTQKYDAPCVLHLWADIGIGGAPPFGFEAQITLGVGDISATRAIASQAVPRVTVPSNGIAVPVPSANVRVDVRLRTGAAPSNPNCRVYGQISRGAPVVTFIRGSLELTDPAGATISLDPEEFPYAQSLLITACGAGGTISYGFGAIALPAGTNEFPFSGKLSLANLPGGQVFYVVKVVS